MARAEGDGATATVEAAAASRALARAQALWPSLIVSEAELAAHLGQVRAHTESVDTQGEDLVLACACAAGDAAGLALFERLHVANIALHVARLQLEPEQVEELRQLVRVKLFTGRAPSILRYSGRGPLGAWVRMLALRLAMDELRARPQERPLDAEMLESLVSQGPAADDQSLRLAWGPHMREAIEAALSELPAREKTILRLHYIEGLNIDAIGRTYRVHRATVARWLLAIRATVLAKIRERLAMRVPSTTSEVRGAFVALQSELQISFTRVLGTP